jgi:hypothetical protein
MPEYLEATGNLTHPPEEYGVFIHDTCYTAPVAAVLDVLRSIHTAYQRDNSDIQGDYYHVRYAGDVGIDWRIKR